MQAHEEMSIDRAELSADIRVKMTEYSPFCHVKVVRAISFRSDNPNKNVCWNETTSNDRNRARTTILKDIIGLNRITGQCSIGC
jgi:hypothetical protein